MAKLVNIYDVKTRLSQLIERAEKGEEIIIARAGRPVARLTAWQPRGVARKPGRLRGRIRLHKNFDAPLRDDVFETE